MTTEEIIERMWRDVEPNVFISRAEFVASLDGWTITPRAIDGVIAGATLTNGAAFHFVSFGKRKRIPAALMAECLRPILAEHGHVLTRTPKDDARQSRFNRLIGFVAESSDEFWTYFKLEKLRLHGAHPCQS